MQSPKHELVFMSAFKKVGLISRNGSDMVLESLQQLVAFLRSRDVAIVVDPVIGQLLPDTCLDAHNHEYMGEFCDLIIVVGGDGNILGAARTLAPFGVPILGVNRGRLGFLADVSPDDIETQVGEVLQGDFSVEEHFLLEGEISTDGKVVAEGAALNEIVVHPGTLPRMLEFDLFIDGKFVYTQHSDGLIISTPTGSTAYSLSAGGPIMHPSLDAIVLVPMFPHTLNSRPIVIPGDCEIRIAMSPEIRSNAQVSFDSQLDVEAGPGDAIVVRKRNDRLKLIHPPGHSFYEVCRSKLDWASRLGE
jgi:NAD+ kinase